jgi:hypothetical protein
MSDFSELCPLFNTGVFNEITFPHIGMSGISASGNALYGSLWPSITMAGYFTFGRTVVITDAFVRRYSLNEASQFLYLRRHTGAVSAVSGVAGTIFGTCTVTPTISILDNYAWLQFGNVTSMTFTSTDILGIAPATGTATSAGGFDLIIRYRER